MLHRLILSCLSVAFLALGAHAAYAQDSELAPPEAGGSICPSDPIDTLIHVKMETPEPIINHTKSRYDLRDFDVSTKSPYGDKNFTHVNGLMRGPVELTTKMTIAWQSDASRQENCFWYRTITLTLKLQPTIYVAKEIPKGTCYFNAIIQHEMKHVEVDRGLIRDYQNIIYDTIENYVHSAGPLDHSPMGDEKAAQKKLTKDLEREVQDIHVRMREDRIERQAAIDTLGEYNRVADECDLDDMLKTQ